MSQTDQYRIDWHKLHLHPRQVADWLDGRDIVPLYMEISSSGACNHRCRFCSLDFMGYQKRFLPLDIMSEKLAALRAAGLKSVMYAGDGEPLMHPDTAALTMATKKNGLDVAFTTNGVFLTEQLAASILPYCSWIKISINAGRPETYGFLHGAKPSDYGQVLANVKTAVRLRESLGSSCTLGLQMLLLPENENEALHLAATARDSGADYLVIKPHAVHPKSGKTAYNSIQYGDYEHLAEEMATYETASFKVVFRHEALKRRSDGPSTAYDRCLALPFWAYVDAGGGVWTCSRHLGEDEFYCGNLLSDNIVDIFGPARREKIALCTDRLDISACRLNCRMDPINAWLWELTHPGAHDNFI